MALEFTDIVIKIQKTLNKYKKNISVGDYIALQEDLNSLEGIVDSAFKILREKSAELHQCSEAFFDTRHAQDFYLRYYDLILELQDVMALTAWQKIKWVLKFNLLEYKNKQRK